MQRPCNQACASVCVCVLLCTGRSAQFPSMCVCLYMYAHKHPGLEPRLHWQPTQGLSVSCRGENAVSPASITLGPCALLQPGQQVLSPSWHPEIAGSAWAL